MGDSESKQGMKYKIYVIRNQRVMIDSDLAFLYGVETKYINKAVGRNINRFPKDFAFQVTEIEWEILRFQIGTSKPSREKRGGRRTLPYVFTEQGVAMLSSVLRSEKAALVNIEIMRAFVNTRKFIATNQELAGKILKLEKKYDIQFAAVFDAIKKLMQIPNSANNKKIGIIKEE